MIMKPLVQYLWYFPNEDITNIFELTLERERIKIKVSEKTFKLYNQMSKNYQITNSNDNIVLLTLMVLPVFIETLNRLKNSSEMCKEYIWYDPLIEAFNKKGIDILNEFVITLMHIRTHKLF